MNTEKIRDFLAEIELFYEFTDTEKAIIADFMVIEEYKKDDIIYKIKSERDKLYIVFRGCIEEYKEDDLGTEYVVYNFKKRDFFGEGSVLDSYPHSLNTRATQNTTLITLHRSSIAKIMLTNAEIVVKLITAASQVIARRVRNSAGKMATVAAHYTSGETRTEKDLLGERELPNDAFYGIQTLRAMENFDISETTLNHYPQFIKSLAMVKLACAKANFEDGKLEKKISDAIIKACQKIIDGKYMTHFLVDMIQGGAGTSTNMNANEVIANIALGLLGKNRGEYEFCHPNNHVNLSQSTNDVYPTALKITLINYNQRLMKSLKELIDSLRRKSEEFNDVIKVGRTQLQDAVPMTLGLEFGAYATTLEEELSRMRELIKLFYEINLGGTAIGTGLNATNGYREKAVSHLREISGYHLKEASDLVESTQDTGGFVMYSSVLKRLAIKLSKICNDLRLLSSGPRAGFNEINLPKMQPGSSIMPGKVNPVIPEVVNQIAYDVIGNDVTITMAAEAGQLQLNVMEPVIAKCLFESIQHLRNGMKTLNYRCIVGITANKENLYKMVHDSIGLVTALVPILGYEVCSSIAKEALISNRGVCEIALERKLLSQKELDKLLSPENMVQH